MARPVAPSFVGYQRQWIRTDLIAGLTVWAVLVPESLAYATIAGVPPVNGLYAAVPALVLYALMGSSRHLVVSPMSATAALSFGVVSAVTSDHRQFLALTTALALATGIVAVLAGLLRLGFLASFISEPVLKGFVIGLALTIIVGQLPALLGTEGGSGDFFEKLGGVISHLGGATGIAIAVGLSSLAALVLMRRLVPLLPGSLVVALLAIGATRVFGLDGQGLDIVGHIDSGLPSPGLPDVGLHDFLDLLAGAVGVMLVGFAEGLGAAKNYAARAGYDIDVNRELLGLGAANLGAGLLSGMVVNGSLSKTAVNGSAGARSQISTVTAGMLTIITLLFLTGLFEYLPEATLAAIVIVAVVELVNLSSLRRLWRLQAGPVARAHPLTARADFLAAAAALIGVLAFETLPGLIIGIGVSLILLLARTSRPYVASLVPSGAPEPDGGRPWVDSTRHPELPAPSGCLVVRVEAPLLFANADYVRGAVRTLADERIRSGGLRLVVLDGYSTPSIDVTAAGMLQQLRGDLQRMGCDLALAENVGQVRDLLGRADPEGGPTLYATIETAMKAATPASPAAGHG